MTTDLDAAITAAIPAVLGEMDWPDDREFSAHVEPDGYQLTPPGAYWNTAGEIATAVLTAAAPLIVAAERERIATAILTDQHERIGCCNCGPDAEHHAAIARAVHPVAASQDEEQQP